MDKEDYEDAHDELDEDTGEKRDIPSIPDDVMNSPTALKEPDYPVPTLKNDVIIVEYVDGEEVYGPPREGKPTIPRGRGEQEARLVAKNGLEFTTTDEESGVRTKVVIPASAILQIRILSQRL